jgi:hypothetical protein
VKLTIIPLDLSKPFPTRRDMVDKSLGRPISSRDDSAAVKHILVRGKQWAR